MLFHYELRFDVSDIEFKKIEYRLKPLMHCENSSFTDFCLVRSLYFDDYKNTALEGTMADLSARKEFRLRTYNNDLSDIHLERKIKKRSMIHKDDAVLPYERCMEYIDGGVPEIGINSSEVEIDLYAAVRSTLLKPKCIVEYERTSFRIGTCNVNIAFDRNIRGSMHVKDFFEQRLDAVPVLNLGHHILEINYDEALPDYILAAVNIGNLSRQSYSKYMQARLAIGM